MKSYSSYKDSGVEWIGNIPSDWGNTKLKYVSQLFTGNSLNDEQKKLYESENLNDIPYVSSKDIDVDFRTVNYDNGLRIPRDNNPLKISPTGSFLLCVEGGSSGRKMVFLDRDVCFVNKLCSFYSSQNTKFQYYFVQSSNFQDKFKLSLTGLIGGVSISTLKNFELPLPPLSEQTQIVSFLDTKTQKIDELIEKTEQKIKLLKEKRTSLINHCVTKGLNPDVEMRDSGVEWIGEIPRDWKLLKFWLIISSSDLGGNYNCSSEYEGYPVMKMGNLGRGSINLKKIEYIDNNSNVDKNHILQNGDFLFNTRNSKELVGKVSLWKNELPISIYNSNILRICFNKNVSNDYMNYLFNSNSILDVLKMISKGTTNVSGIYFKDLSNIYICLPSKHEQTQIVEYLDEQTQNIDSTIEKETQRIELLKEYRQSLISEVVTGKVDVRDYNG